ncbi:hypothetical protein RI367_003240 [Sorochytrium milnesiophthora]
MSAAHPHAPPPTDAAAAAIADDSAQALDWDMIDPQLTPPPPRPALSNRASWRSLSSVLHLQPPMYDPESKPPAYPDDRFSPDSRLNEALASKRFLARFDLRKGVCCYWVVQRIFSIGWIAFSAYCLSTYLQNVDSDTIDDTDDGSLNWDLDAESDAGSRIIVDLVVHSLWIIVITMLLLSVRFMWLRTFRFFTLMYLILTPAEIITVLVSIRLAGSMSFTLFAMLVVRIFFCPLDGHACYCLYWLHQSLIRTGSFDALSADTRNRNSIPLTRSITGLFRSRGAATADQPRHGATGAAMLLTIYSLGALCNGFLCYVFLKRQRSASYNLNFRLTTCLNLADTIIPTLLAPCFAIKLYYRSFALGFLGCQVEAALISCGVTWSAFCIVILALERYMYIVKGVAKSFRFWGCAVLGACVFGLAYCSYPILAGDLPYVIQPSGIYCLDDINDAPDISRPPQILNLLMMPLLVTTAASCYYAIFRRVRQVVQVYRASASGVPQSTQVETKANLTPVDNRSALDMEQQTLKISLAITMSFCVMLSPYTINLALVTAGIHTPPWFDAVTALCGISNLLSDAVIVYLLNPLAHRIVNQELAHIRSRLCFWSGQSSR